MRYFFVIFIALSTASIVFEYSDANTHREIRNCKRHLNSWHYNYLK